jgi:hypothetical protein
MAGAELERTEDHIDEENEVDLSPRQISALDKLTKLGAEPRQSPDDKYDSDPQIRALQMVFEGRIGGPGRGQGRKSEKERVNRVLAERFRRKVAKLEKVIDEALDDDNIKVAMDAVRLVSDLDAKDAKQSLQEEQFEHDADNMDKEQLILALFQQLENPQVEAALRAQGEVITSQTQRSGRSPRVTKPSETPSSSKMTLTLPSGEREIPRLLRDLGWSAEQLLEMEPADLREILHGVTTLGRRLQDDGPQNDEELDAWIQVNIGVKIPRTCVCPDHQSPFQFLADLYFERIGSALALANRGGSKTFVVAILHFLNCTFKPGCEALSFGATEAQGNRCYGNIEDWCYVRDPGDGTQDRAGQGLHRRQAHEVGDELEDGLGGRSRCRHAYRGVGSSPGQVAC